MWQQYVKSPRSASSLVHSQDAAVGHLHVRAISLERTRHGEYNRRCIQGQVLPVFDVRRGRVTRTGGVRVSG